MPPPRKYPDELRERATRMTLEARQDPATRTGAFGTDAPIGVSRLHAASAGVWSMINSYSTGVNRPRRTCRRRW